MDRKSFAQKLTMLGLCPFIIQNLTGSVDSSELLQQEDLQVIKSQKKFIENWLSDLIESMDKHLDRDMQEKIVGECGVACFNRHQFKKDIAITSDGNLEKLLENYKKNFEVWKDNDTVHIRYGEVSNQCYCPAANYRSTKPNDIHCECTRNTHKAIFETALGRPFKVDVVESLRRGGKTCHFVVHLA